VQRGHNRERCFFSEADDHAYLHWLKEALRVLGLLGEAQARGETICAADMVISDRRWSVVHN
jgi:hypothetical protein